MIRAEKGYATSGQLVKCVMMCPSAQFMPSLIINVWKAGPPMEPNPATVAKPNNTPQLDPSADRWFCCYVHQGLISDIEATATIISGLINAYILWIFAPFCPVFLA